MVSTGDSVLGVCRGPLFGWCRMRAPMLTGVLVVGLSWSTQLPFAVALRNMKKERCRYTGTGYWLHCCARAYPLVSSSRAGCFLQHHTFDCCCFGTSLGHVHWCLLRVQALGSIITPW